MNNPYRARPTRSRVDHSVGYGAHNQNMWNPMARSQSEITSNESIQHQTAMSNQSKQTADPWNNSWNWDFDKQAESQQQQQQKQQQQPQQPHFVPSYTNQGQLISNSVQDQYYQNANGNKSDLLNQNSVSGRNTPGSISNRQPISNQPDSFTPYSNYSQNQQYPPPPRPNSVKSPPMNFDHPQWTNEQQSQSLPYSQQRSAMLNQNDQALHPLAPPSNYSWSKQEQPNLMSQHNWQNHTSLTGHWQDPNVDKDVQHVDDIDMQQNRSAQMFPPSSEITNKEHSMNWSNGKQGIESNNWPNQSNVTTSLWHNQNRESILPGHQTAPAYNSDNEMSWPHPTNLDAPRMHHRRICLTPPPDLATDLEERKTSVPSSIANSSIPKDSDNHVKTSGVKSQHPDSQNNMPSPPEGSILANPPNVHMQEDNDFNLASDPLTWTRRNSTEELPAKLDQLSLGTKANKHTEHQSDPLGVHSSNTGDGLSQEATSTFGVNTPRTNVAADNKLPADYATPDTENSHSIESHGATAQEHNAYQVANEKPLENVTQSGYDQWYNQNSLPISSENLWYAKDHGTQRPGKQWAEQNVENYENIQQQSEFVNLEVVAPSLQERDIYGSRDSINKETLDNDPKPVPNLSKEAASARDFRQEVNNIEVPSVQPPPAPRSHPPIQAEQVPDNYEFASNDRNTFLETGELTDSHQEHEPTPPSQDDENDEVPSDIPFLREVPGQSSSIDPRRNDPTGQEQYVQAGQRLPDPRRNDPSGQEQSLQLRNMPDRSERRDVPPGQERSAPLLSRSDSDTLERRNDPSGRERSLPPQQSRNDPSGEERYQSQSQMLEPSETREVPGRGNEAEDPTQQADENLRQIPGGASPNEVIQSSDDRTNGRVVTGSQEAPSTVSTIQDQTSDSRSKREEAVGASMRESQVVTGSSNRRDSYEDEDDEDSGHSRDDSRERRRDSSPERRRYDYDRKNAYSYDREREYEDDYYYDRRRGGDNDRAYNSRDEFDRREVPYRDEERKHLSRDDLDRHARDEVDRRNRPKDDLDDRDGRRRPDDRRRDRGDDMRRRDREVREYDPRYSRDREYLDRDRRRDDRRTRRYDDYDIRDTSYRREYYEDPYNRSSRPSSRSSYNDRDREYYMRSRDPYYGGYSGYPGYDYGTHYNNYYAYVENLRRTNPAAYSEWYHKYYASQQQAQQHMARGVSNYSEDRASVHSGRSSCDERYLTIPSACFHSPNKALYVSHFGYRGWARSPLRRQYSACQNLNRTSSDKRTLGELSQLDDTVNASARMTPTKFYTSHAYGCFSIGSLIHVHPNYPADGERAKVDILRMDNLLSHDPIARDLRTYPGPLIKGVTHKKTIIEYCENKIKKAAANEEMTDRASYILLYELMIMLIQQNGNVVGVDIATLLLMNKDEYPYDTNKQRSQDSGRRESVISQRSGATGGDAGMQDVAVPSEKTESTKPRKSIEEITDEFRNTLLYGLVQEALEYAMNEGLWGHALFLASKLDKRTHASVMTRFANSLPHHDPLQTLYQLHSGRVPAVVTCIADPRWDDWRPHLAMIISNTSANPEVNRRSITTLGDTLSARGDIHAAHFCYILAQIDFGAFGGNNVKLVLIGTNHHKPYAEFFTTEAVMLTEIYEYARNLSEPGFTLVDLQSFKFDLAVKMVDYGLIEKALLYIEQIAVNIVHEPSKYKKSFIDGIYNLGDRIKYHDPIYKDSTDDATTLTWLNNLAEIVGKCQTGEIIENNVYGSQVKLDSHNPVQNQEVYEMKQQQQQQQTWNTIQPEYEGPASMMEVPANEMQSEWQQFSLPSNIQDTYDQNVQYPRSNDDSNQYQQPQQQEYWPQDTYYQSTYGRNDVTAANWQQPPAQIPYSAESSDVDGSQQQEKWNYEKESEDKTSTPEPAQQPSISMTPSSGKQYDPLEELDALDTPKTSLKPAAGGKKTTEKTNEKKPTNGGGSWFGGLFSKLAPKPKNQMILPDDNNPTIVWDPVAKKWMNKDEDGDTSSAAVGPPPKATDMGFRPPAIEQNAPTSQPSMQVDDFGATNKFKLQKGRNMRANYIDVMNPNGPKGGSISSNIPTPATSPMVPMATSSPQLFVPAPVNDPSAPVDFLTPTTTPVVPTANASENASQGLSRWSSTSSLSREVQSYTMRDPRLLLRNKGPMMYNPNDMKDRSAKNIQQSRYPPR